MLSTDQIAEFRDRGCVIIPQLLSPAEVLQLRAEVDNALRSAFGADYGRNTRSEELSDGEIAAEGNFLPLMADRAPLSLALVADDPRLLPTAKELIGVEVLPVSPALATCMVSDTPWHNDPGTGERWVRFNAYLDPVGEATGALRVKVGSHDDLRADPSSDLDDVAVLETKPGDVIAFDPRAMHASFGGTHRLRWCVDYAALPSGDDRGGVEATRGLVEELASWPHPPEWPVWRTWARNASHPRRLEAVAALRQLGVDIDD